MIAGSIIGLLFPNVKDIVVTLPAELDPVRVPLPEVCELLLSGIVPDDKVDELFILIPSSWYLLSLVFPSFCHEIFTELIGRSMPTILVITQLSILLLDPEVMLLTVKLELVQL